MLGTSGVCDMGGLGIRGHQRSPGVVWCCVSWSTRITRTSNKETIRYAWINHIKPIGSSIFLFASYLIDLGDCKASVRPKSSSTKNVAGGGGGKSAVISVSLIGNCGGEGEGGGGAKNTSSSPCNKTAL